MGNPIMRLFEESGMSVQEFASAADLKYSTAYDIVHGKANMENIGAGAFVRIARVFNTTADALLSSADVDSDGLWPDERELLSLYRKMEQSEQSLLIEVAQRFSSLGRSVR